MSPVIRRPFFVGQFDWDSSELLCRGKFIFKLENALLEQTEMGVVLVVPLLQLDGQELLVAFQLVDDLLRLVVLSLEPTQMCLKSLRNKNYLYNFDLFQNCHFKQ